MGVQRQEKRGCHSTDGRVISFGITAREPLKDGRILKFGTSIIQNELN